MSDTLDRAAKLPPTSWTYEVRQLAAPAAGTDFTIPVPSGEVWRLVAINATLATSAAVANRDPKLTIDDQTSVSAVYAAGVVTAAGATVRYVWLAGFPQLMGSAEAGLVDVPIIDHVLQMGWRARVVTGALDVADQWSSITFTIERLNTPPESIAGRYVRLAESMRDIADTLEAEGY